MVKAIYYYKNSNAPKPNKPNHIGVNILIEFNDMLLEKRTDNETWGLIGGGLKIDESLIQGAIRETREETGILLKDEELEFYKIFDDPTRIAEYDDGNVIRIISVVYNVYLKNKPELICSDESVSLEFFKKTDIVQLQIVESYKPLINDYLLNTNK